MRTVPAEGSIIRLKVRSSVVFPEPLSPTSATVSPDWTASVTPARRGGAVRVGLGDVGRFEDGLTVARG